MRMKWNERLTKKKKKNREYKRDESDNEERDALMKDICFYRNPTQDTTKTTDESNETRKSI